MLVSMKEILDKANKDNYGVLAPNVFTEFDARAYLEAAEDLNAPIILDVAMSCTPDLIFIGKVLQELCRQCRVPAAVNLDHGADFDQVMMAVRGGFTSVMIDCSMWDFEENVRRVKTVVDMVSPLGITVEAELGHVGQGADYEAAGAVLFTNPGQAKNYIEKTGIDALAVAIGTAHGAYRGTPELDFDRLAEIKKATEFPLVLHGSSGTGDEKISKACKLGINKINVCNELLWRTYKKLQSADLAGNNAYELWNVVGDSLKSRVKELIMITGSYGKSWTKTPDGLKRSSTTMREA